MGLAARPGRGVPAVHDAHGTRRNRRIRGTPDRNRRLGVAAGVGAADRSRRKPPPAPAPTGVLPGPLLPGTCRRSAGRSAAHRSHTNHRRRSTYAVFSGVSFECRLTGARTDPSETSSPEVCSFQLPQVCSFRLPLTLSEGRRRVTAGRPHCARPPQRYGPSRDTPPAPRLGGQSGALRPGLDARVPTVHNVPGTRRATELRTPTPDRNRRSRCRGTPPFGRRADGGVGLVRRGGRRNHGTGDRPRATDASRPSTGRADRRSLTRTAALGWSRRRRATADPRRAPRAPNSSARAGLTCWPETGRPRPRPWQIMSVQRAPAHRSPRQDPCFRPLIRPPSPRLTCRRFRLISGLERTNPHGACQGRNTARRGGRSWPASTAAIVFGAAACAGRRERPNRRT